MAEESCADCTVVGISLVSCDARRDSGKVLTAHRFAKEESLKEIHRVLKPGAKLGLIWNVEDCEMLHSTTDPRTKADTLS
jgi:hypothetical protein